MLNKISSVITALLNKIAISDYREVIAKAIKLYFSATFRKEIVDKVNFDNLLHSALTGTGRELGQPEAKAVLEHIYDYVTTKKTLITKYEMERKKKEKEESLQDLDPTNRIWAEGIGPDIEAILLKNIEETIHKKDLAEPEDYTALADKMLLQEKGSLKEKELDIFKKVLPDIVIAFSGSLKDYFKNPARDVLKEFDEHPPLESLEPSYDDKEKGVTREKREVTNKPVEDMSDEGKFLTNKGDLDKIEAYAKEHFSDVEKIILDNILYGKEWLEDNLTDAEIKKVETESTPVEDSEEEDKKETRKEREKKLSDNLLSAIVKKKTGKELTGQRLGQLKKKVLSELHAEFFSGVKKQEKPSTATMKIHEMSPEDLESFTEFVKDQMEDKTKGRPSPAIKENAINLIKELSKGTTIKSIAEALKINEETLKKISQRKLQPYYSEWLKSKKEKAPEKKIDETEKRRLEELKKRNAAMFNLRQAIMLHTGGFDEEVFSSIVHNVMASVSDGSVVLSADDVEDEGTLESLEELKKPGKVTLLPRPDVKDENIERNIEKLLEKGEKKDQKKLDEGRAQVREEKKKKEPSEKKQLVKEKFEKMITKRFLGKTGKDMVPPKINIEFSALYDWTDVGLGKFNPVIDSEKSTPDRNAWVKDDPHFAWLTYEISLKKSTKIGKSIMELDYTYSQELNENGSDKGPYKGHLKVVKDGEVLIQEDGAPDFRAFMDRHYEGVRALGIPPEEGKGVGARYNNRKLDRTYAGTNSFEDAMGGLAFSDPIHKGKADQYKEFQSRLEEHQSAPKKEYAPDSIQKRKITVKQLTGVFNSLLKRSESDEDKVKIKEILDLLNKDNPSKEDVEKAMEFKNNLYKKEKDNKKENLTIDL